jgi:hypothetical protein
MYLHACTCWPLLSRICCTALTDNDELMTVWPSSSVCPGLNGQWTLDKDGWAQCEQPGRQAALPRLLTFSLAIHCLFCQQQDHASAMSQVIAMCAIWNWRNGIVVIGQKTSCRSRRLKHYSVGVNTFGTVRTLAVMTAGPCKLHACSECWMICYQENNEKMLALTN